MGQKPFINRKNTALSFEKLKAALEKDQPSLEKPTKKTTVHRIYDWAIKFSKSSSSFGCSLVDWSIQ